MERSSGPVWLRKDETGVDSKEDHFDPHDYNLFPLN